MENRKPLNFAQALRAKPGQSTTAEREESTTIDSQLSTLLDSQLSTTSDSQISQPSQLSTTPAEPAIKQAQKRKVDSHRRKRVDSRKGDRHRSDKAPFNNRISQATLNRIKHFIVDHDLEQQEFTELAAIYFMDAVDSHQVPELDSKIALDDRRKMILFKTELSIINLYLRYNPDNRWKPGDDIEGQKYNGKDIRVIEIGIITTQFNAQFKRIHSFKYYATEIDIALETPLSEQTIIELVKHQRRQWERATGREMPAIP